MLILQDLCTHKSPKKIVLFKEASAIISYSLCGKCKDSIAPLISCEVGDITFKSVLLDLGSSVNLLLVAILIILS